LPEPPRWFAITDLRLGIDIIDNRNNNARAILDALTAQRIEAKDAKIGYVGAFPYAEVKSGYTAFFLGVRSVCKEATMEVQFTGSWYD